jgi:HEAT repeat protein
MWSALALINNKSYDKATIPILVQVLRHENPTLRQVACLSLALIPYVDAEKETVLPALVETANKDADDEVRKTAISALKIIAPDLAAGGK